MNIENHTSSINTQWVIDCLSKWYIVATVFWRLSLCIQMADLLEVRRFMHLRREQSPLAYSPSLSCWKEKDSGETGDTSRVVTIFPEARRTPWLLLVTQCDVSSECFTFNKIHCRLTAPVSYRVSQKQVECVLCGGSPSPRVNLVVWIFSFRSFFFLYIFSTRLQEHKECGGGGVGKQLAPRQLGVVLPFHAISTVASTLHSSASAATRRHFTEY